MWRTTKRETPPLEWAWVEERLTRCEDYWVVTADPDDGRPAARPVWGVWMPDGDDGGGRGGQGEGEREGEGAGKLLLTLGSTTHWRNTERNPHVTVTTGDAHEVVIVEGIASTVDATDVATLRPMIERYNPKYGWDFPDTGPDIGGVLAVTPRTILAWIAGPNDTAKQNEFPIAAARWTSVSA
jgi:hypothetical protein